MVPSRPAWKSSNACRSSASSFMTNGPYQATGSRIGRPPRTRTSSSGLRDVLAASAAHRDRVAGAEHRELPGAQRPALGADGARTRPSA